MPDQSQPLGDQVTEAISQKRALYIQGNNTKAFLGNECDASTLDVSNHSGILHYEPTELVITARAGTPLSEIIHNLDAHQQMLAFEPPAFGEHATLGGTIACNLSGPRRPYTGAARDYVLGCRMINGQGQIMQFGGEVMKNVAGYDVSRLMTGSLGTLGILLDVSLKVVPKPQKEITISKEVSAEQALQLMAHWRQQPAPISASCHDGQQLFFRLSGTEQALKAARNKIGGERVDNDTLFWQRLNEHQHAFFNTRKKVWRLSLPSTAPLLELEGKTMMDWGGAQRWLVSDANPETVRTKVASIGGHATVYRNNNTDTNSFHPLDGNMLFIHQQLKKALDPHGLFNPGKMYSEI